MKNRNPSYSPPPRRGHYRRRSPSPSPRGRYGGRSRAGPTSLLVRNVRRDCSRPDDLRGPFREFGPIKDIYLPRDFHSGEPRGFGFVQYFDPEDAAEAKYHMDRQILLGREIAVVFAEESRKKPEEMRGRQRGGLDRHRSPYYERSHFRSRSRSHDRSGSPRSRYSRSFSSYERRYREDSYTCSSVSRSPSPRGSSRSRSLSRSRSPSFSRSYSQSSDRHGRYASSPGRHRERSRSFDSRES